MVPLNFKENVPPGISGPEQVRAEPLRAGDIGQAVRGPEDALHLQVQIMHSVMILRWVDRILKNYDFMNQDQQNFLINSCSGNPTSRTPST